MTPNVSITENNTCFLIVECLISNFSYSYIIGVFTSSDDKFSGIADTTGGQNDNKGGQK
jgi:hypothetical protein